MNGSLFVTYLIAATYRVQLNRDAFQAIKRERFSIAADFDGSWNKLVSRLRVG
jgi:hypothetical protein